MKKVLFILSMLLFAIQAGNIIAFCCNGDGCPYSLGRYVDDKGNPTGQYALLDENYKPVFIKKGPDCMCIADIGKRFPASTCPNCVEARCPRVGCGHHIFQHTCFLNVRATPGTAIYEVLEEPLKGSPTNAPKPTKPEKAREGNEVGSGFAGRSMKLPGAMGTESNVKTNQKEKKK